jgi:hypothetical protein
LHGMNKTTESGTAGCLSGSRAPRYPTGQLAAPQ